MTGSLQKNNTSSYIIVRVYDSETGKRKQTWMLVRTKEEQTKKLDSIPGFVEHSGSSSDSVRRMLEKMGQTKKKDCRINRKPLIVLVAGGGFEPPTFGL